MSSLAAKNQPAPAAWRSKMGDGIGAGFAFLLLVALLIALTIFAKRAGPLVLGVEAMLMLGASLWLVQRSRDTALQPVTQAWLGVLGGMLAWTAAEAGALLGFIKIETHQGAIIFAIAAGFFLVNRRDLRLGAQFWAAAFLLNWLGHLILFIQHAAYAQYPATALMSLRLSGVLAGGAIVALSGWILVRSQTRLQRLWAGLWLFMLAIIIVYAIRGFW